MLSESLRAELAANLRDKLRRVFRLWKSPPKLTVSQWADADRVLSPEASNESGRYSTARAPYQKGIMDAVSERESETVVIMSSAQIGKTEIILNILGYFVAHDAMNTPILVVVPTLDMGKSFSKDRLEPMFRDTPSLREKFSNRSKDASNTILHKQFPGGHITIAGSNSPASLASRPIRICLMDEIDRHAISAGKDGNPQKLAEKRTTTYQANRKIILVSTPVLKYVPGEGGSQIEKAWLESDQRRYFVPCPHCGHEQVFEWERLIWAKDDDGKHLPQTAKYQCAGCDEFIDEKHKYPMLVAGKWIVTKPENRGKAGFHINELYSPWRKWSQIVEDFLDAKDDVESYKVWLNTSLGLSYQYQGDEVPDWRTLYNRRQDYPIGVVPSPGCVLVAGVDVQKDRIEATVMAASRSGLFLVDHVVLPGNPLKDDVWQDLTNLLHTDWPHENGHTLKIRRLAIDSGYMSSRVYEWVRSQDPRIVMAVKGREIESPLATPKHLDITIRGKRIKRGLKLWGFGSGYLKSELYSRLKIPMPTERERKRRGWPTGFIHFPGFDEEFFKQLCSEACIAVKLPNGHVRYEWHKIYPNNEVLDNMAMGLAAYYSIGANKWSDETWAELEAVTGPPPVAMPLKKSKKRKTSSYWGERKKSGFLKSG